MRNVLLMILLISAFSCQENEVTPGCIDESQINTDAACITLYDPVCGCDNVTYSNDCVARNAGVTSFERGVCNSEE